MAAYRRFNKVTQLTDVEGGAFDASVSDQLFVYDATSDKFLPFSPGELVHTSDNEDISGLKVFTTDIPQIPIVTPTLNSEVASKKYVDDTISGVSAGSLSRQNIGITTASIPS